MTTNSPLFHVGRPTGYHQEFAGTGYWQTHLPYQLKESFGPCRFTIDPINSHRILQARNILVQRARLNRANYLLMLDPDMIPDVRCGSWPDAEPFMKSAKRQLDETPLCVLAAPARGPSPSHEGTQHWRVHTFTKGEDGEIRRLTMQEAAALRGWQQMEAVGSGLMLIPMEVFAALDDHAERLGSGVVPYFDDVYADETKTDIHYTQDLYFCLRCRDAGIPIFVNFSAWSGHWQWFLDDGAWEMPSVEDYSRVFVRSVSAGV